MSDTGIRPQVPIHALIERWQVLFTSLLAFAGASAGFLIDDFPLHPGFCCTVYLSGALHLAIFLFFRRMTSPLAWRVVHFINIVLAVLVIHFSGGIMSPFILILFFILMSGSVYGIDERYSLALSAAAFLTVIGAEYAGILDPVLISPSDIYSSPPTTALIVLALLGFFSMSGRLYKQTVRTLRERLERDHRERREMLDRLARLDGSCQVGMVAANIVHDLRGPLGAFEGFVRVMVEEESLAGDLKEDCRTMIVELRRIQGLIGRMLHYVKPSRADMESVSLREVMESVLAVIAFHERAGRVEFRRDLGGPRLPRIRGNREQLQQLFFNIAKNALDALRGHEPPRFVEVTLRAEDGGLTMTVKDNGKGIPESVQRKLMHESVSTKSDGTGLGLIIAREIVEAHRGSMKIESVEGVGTRVVLRLPAEDAAGHEPAPGKNEPAE